MKKVDILIVGAGPAGLKAAEILAKNGKEVLVFEKNKKIVQKVCTGIYGLTPKTLEMNIPSSIFDKKFKRVIFHTPHQSTIIKENYFFVASIDREKLGKWQLKKAKKAGAEIKLNSEVTKITKDFVVVNNEKIRYNYLIGADGSNSIVRRYLKLPTNVEIGIQYWIKRKFKDLDVFFDVDKFGPWYAWIVPHDTITSVGTGSEPSIIPIQKLKENLCEWMNKKGIDYFDAKFEAAPINYHYCGFDFGNIFIVGDAAGFPSGLTGEGIYFAMASGYDVSNKIINPTYECEKIRAILHIKKIHEEILKLFMFNKTLKKAEYELLVLLCKNKLFDKKAIELLF